MPLMYSLQSWRETFSDCFDDVFHNAKFLPTAVDVEFETRNAFKLLGELQCFCSQISLALSEAE